LIFGFLKSPELSPRLLRLKESALFSSLTPLELKIVDGLMHERRYLADEIIFDEGEEGQALYLVMSGRVIISRHLDAGREVVAELSAGAFFGDLALLDNSPRNAQTRALDNCELAVFFRADFMGLMETDPVIGYKISLALARHIGRRLRDWMTGKPQIEAL
jgi:CRP-like cAMP-binding protein